MTKEKKVMKVTLLHQKNVLSSGFRWLQKLNSYLFLTPGKLMNGHKFTLFTISCSGTIGWFINKK